MFQTELSAKWNMNTVPAVFWERIEKSGGDPELYVQAFEQFNADELMEVYYQFVGLAQGLVIAETTNKPPEVEELQVMDQEEIAAWVITQGKAYYLDVLTGQKPYPTREMRKRPIYTGTIIRYYKGKFGPFRSDY